MSFLHTSRPSTPHLKEKGKNEKVVRIQVTVLVGGSYIAGRRIFFKNLFSFFS